MLVEIELIHDTFKLAICVFGQGASYQVWASGTDENIVLATKAARKAKRDYKLNNHELLNIESDY